MLTVTNLYREIIYATYCKVVGFDARNHDCFQFSISSHCHLTKCYFKGVFSQLVTAIFACAFIISCAEQRTLTLEPAAEDLFDQSAPILIRGSHSIGNRHSRVVSGALDGIGTGMAQGALASLAGGASTGNIYAAALGVVLMPVFAVGGGVTGGVLAHSSEETTRALKAIEFLYDDDPFLEQINDKLKKRFAKLGIQETARCQEMDSIENPNSNPLDSISSPKSCGEEIPVNTLNVASIYRFFTQGTYSPDLIFSITVEAIAANANRKRVAQEFRWIYLSPSFDFFAATAENAESLRQKINSAQDLLVEAITDDLFLARHAVTVTGRYFPDRQGVKFIPESIAPGIVRRVPTQSQLQEVPELATNSKNQNANQPPNIDKDDTHAKSRMRNLASGNETPISPKRTLDKIKIKQAIVDFLDINSGGDSCWGDINVVPSGICTLHEVQGISVEKVEGDQILVTGRYVLESRLERRSFVSSFMLVHDGKKFRVLDMRPT